VNLSGKGIQERAEKGGVVWAGLLGIIFALSFCPVSAGLFFAGLIPLAITTKSSVIVPGVYGVATALPVVFFAFLIAFSTEMIGKAFHRITQVEKVVRIGAAILFIVAGIYYSLTHVYGVSF
jgi:threonine/homoserine/homoserine lactone efflux protein